MSPINGSPLEHILSQTRANVEFLISQNHISSEAGREILNRLSSTGPNSVPSLTDQTRNLNISSGPTYAPPTGPPSSNYSPAPNAARAKAIWGYNEDASDPNDLSFRTGDVIEIVDETNRDWWTGRHNGRQGLFPSNYVEKLPPSTLPPKPDRSPSYNSYGPPSGPPPPSRPYYAPSTGPPGPPGPPGPGYMPSYQPPVGYQGPPPPSGPTQPYPPYASPPPVPASAPPAPVEPKKQGKLGGLGNTLAHSAVGGAGFGAGSAVGSGLINSIF